RLTGRLTSMVGDGAHALTGSGALAVLALPPVGTLPQRRRAAAAVPVPVPRTFVTPAVLRQPWASDLATMRRLVAALHRMS
ncbi:hypothetical protein, partial [Pseudonocardia zijingensis]|uniref:hypothetical protein n=1 Tax=Pseudonocardia zijingensis TaxID=153376 RepID=UPI0031D3DA49